MAVKIRLARFGRNKVPFYSIVVTDSRNRRDSKFIEKIGVFNPLLLDDNKEKIVLNKERAEYWLSVGALPTERVALLLIKIGVKDAEKYKPVFVPKIKQEKNKVVEPSTEKPTENKVEVKEEVSQKVEVVEPVVETPVEAVVETPIQ